MERTMPKATQPTTTRRRLCGGSAALLAIAGFVPAAAAVVAPATAAHPDAELLDLLSRFDALERQVAGSYSTGGEQTPAAWNVAEATRNTWQAKQVTLLASICATPAQTLDGLRARAASLVLWDADAHARVVSGDDKGDYWDDRMEGALLRDLVRDRGSSSLLAAVKTSRDDGVLLRLCDDLRTARAARDAIPASAPDSAVDAANDVCWAAGRLGG
jgi:hypothetical protein